MKFYEAILLIHYTEGTTPMALSERKPLIYLPHNYKLDAPMCDTRLAAALSAAGNLDAPLE